MRNPLTNIPGAVWQFLKRSLFQRCVEERWLTSVEGPSLILDPLHLLVDIHLFPFDTSPSHHVVSLHFTIDLVSLFLGEVGTNSTLELDDGDHFDLHLGISGFASLYLVNSLRFVTTTCGALPHFEFIILMSGPFSGFST